MLFDAGTAHLVEGSIVRRPFQFNADNEDDAEAAVQRVHEVLEELRANLLHAPFSILHCGIACYATSLLALDENYAPLTPIYTYADARCAADAKTLRRQHDELTTLQRTGCRIRANYWPAKLLWLKRTQPQVFARARWFCSLADFVCWRLFGVLQTGISIASWTGLLNCASGDWDETWLQALDLRRAQLPPIMRHSDQVASDHIAASLRHSPVTMLHSPVTLHPPVGDGAAANIGSGCVDTHCIAVTIGTTAALRVVVPVSNLKPQFANPALWNYRVDHAHALIGGASTEGGNVFAWAQRVLRSSLSAREERAASALLGLRAGEDELEHALQQQQPDAHGLTVLPMFAGERSPGYAEDVRATLHGLSLDTSPIEITRALLEAVAYRLAMIYDSLRTVAEPNAVLVGSGGALVASPTWCQIIADATNTALHISHEAEATAKGVAILAADRGPLTMNHNPHVAHRPSSIVYQPNQTNHIIYRAAMARQQELYAKLV